MGIERCDECGFDGAAWAADEALAAIAGLPDRWAAAVAGVAEADRARRPIDAMWSIAEYCDHVREVLFGMRFLVDTAIAAPGSDLGAAPPGRFDPEPRAIDVERALAGIRREAGLLVGRLQEIPRPKWAEAVVVVDTEPVDLDWIARHAVHDATHHLDDVDRLRRTLRPTT